MSRANNCYRRAIHSPGIVSNGSFSPQPTPSFIRRARSSALASIITSLVDALPFKPKGKTPVQKLPSPACSVSPLSSVDKLHAKQKLRRARSVPAIGRKQITKCKRTASSGDGMEVDGDEEDIGEEVGPAQYLYYDASENPFATPPGPRTPSTPLSPMMLDNDAETPPSNSDSAKSKNERSKLKSLQILGPEADMAISKQYGDM
ncbi:hypothetical protein C0989_011723 [Termitomyces sp. Mn162]|nr:hypothetical protein C0989_011723 [Termitomyces sp. Mn162]